MIIHLDIKGRQRKLSYVINENNIKNGSYNDKDDDDNDRKMMIITVMKR